MLPNKDLLTPGPWKVNGNTVTDALGRTVAVVFARHSTAHAYWFAEIPRFAEENESSMAEELMMLRSRVAMLEKENAGLYKELEEIRADSDL